MVCKPLSVSIPFSDLIARGPPPQNRLHVQIPPFFLCSKVFCCLNGPLFFAHRGARIRGEHVYFPDQH